MALNWLASSPDILFRIFSGERMTQIKEQLVDLKRILKMKPNYQMIKVSNDEFCKLLTRQ